MYQLHTRPYAFVNNWGDGAVGIVPYALSELGKLDTSAYRNGSTREDFTEMLLDEVSKAANSRFRKSEEYNLAAKTSYILT